MLHVKEELAVFVVLIYCLVAKRVSRWRTEKSLRLPQSSHTHWNNCYLPLRCWENAV